MKTNSMNPRSFFRSPRRGSVSSLLSGLLVLALCACSGSGGGVGSNLKGGGSGGGGNGGGGNGGNGGNGGKGGNGGNGGQNQGSYKLEEFHYKSKLPKTYHPLGKDIFELQRDELPIFIDNFANKMDGLIMDDADGKHRLLSPILGTFPAGSMVFDAAGGQLDKDPPREAVAVALHPTKVIGSKQYFDLRVRVLGTNARGQTTEDQQFTVGIPALNATLRLADVDGDGRDEIILACATGYRIASNKHVRASGASLRVFDDSVGKHALLFKADNLPFSGKITEYDGRVAAGDFDGDGKAEIVFLERTNSDLVRARVFDDAAHGFKRIHSWSNAGLGKFAPFPPLKSNPLVEWADLDVVAGDFDGDGADEIIFAGVDSYNGIKVKLALYDGKGPKNAFDFLGTPKSDGWKHVRYEPYSQHRSWQILAADLDGNGAESLVLHAGSANGSSAPSVYDVSVTQWVFGKDKGKWAKEKSTLTVANTRHGKAGSRMAVIHDVFEKKDRLAVAIANFERLGVGKLEVYRIGKTDLFDRNKKLLGYGMKVETTWFQTLKPSPGAKQVHTPILAPADLQGDGLTLRYTQRKTLTLANPSPICLLAAPPTKSGISQNYDDSEVSYGKSKTTTITHTTSTTTTVSGEVGLSGDFLHAFFSVDVRATYEDSIEKAYGKSRTVTRTTNYVGGHEEDSVVFQGTVYRHYIYTILAAPDQSLIGKKISIDVPVQSRIYKWTLAYYNKTVKPEERLDRSKIFKHKIGSPQSYLKKEKAKVLTNGDKGWMSSVQTVGKGTRVNETTIDIEASNSTEKSRTVTTGGSGELQIGPFVAGGSYGIGNTSIFSIETGIGSHFSGTVGDISDEKDFVFWNYAFGLAIYYQRGGKKNAQGFQVLNFWVDPTGTNY